MHYIGLDVHQHSVVFCIKIAACDVLARGRLPATRPALLEWAEQLPQPWCGALEATPFSAWIYDTLAPFAHDLAVGHPAAMEAISRGKKKSDAIDAATLADLARANLVPRVWVAPPELRPLRRLLRLRRRLVEQSTAAKNRIAATFMELGEPYVKSRLHSKRYFEALLKSVDAGPTDALALTACRVQIELDQRLIRHIEGELGRHRLLVERLERLRSIPGVGRFPRRRIKRAGSARG
jgi:transposase